MELRIEKINVSDNKFLVTSIYHKNGDAVCEGDLIYSIESSKSTKDITAPCSGYVFYVDGLKEFDEYPANFLIAQIVKDNENPFYVTDNHCEEKSITIKDEQPEIINVIATKEALSLAAKHNIDLSRIKAEYITKWDVVEYMKSLDLGTYGYDSTIKKVAIIGAGRGAMQVLDLISQLKQYRAVAIYDDTQEKQGAYVYDVAIRGKVDFASISEDYKMGVFDYIVNAVSVSNEFREHCFDELSKYRIPYCNLIHPSVFIGQYVKIGTGNIIFPNCHIGPNTIIGNDNFFTANASIEHHNIVGDHCTCGPCVMTSGSVKIGNCVKFGTGVFVEPLVEIGDNVLIASGSIVTNNVPSDTIVRHKQNQEFVARK